MARYLVLFLASLFLYGCSGSSKVTTPPAPAWVQQRPTGEIYYIGIGSAKKNTAEYQLAAKQSALADLASDISVVISSQSVLRAFEVHQRFSEDFSSSIQAETQKELEGYELVDTWEDENNYWVYIRLSKKVYRQHMEEKRKKATSQSVDFYQKAINYKNSGDLKTSLVMFIKALEPIKPYFGEAITATVGESKIYLGNEIIQQITEILNSISFDCPGNVLVKMGQPLTSQIIPCKVKTNSNQPVKAIPVRLIYTERQHVNNRLISDNNGMLGFTLEAIRSMKPTEQVKLTLDWESIIQESTTDFSIKRLLMRFGVPSATVGVSIEKPSFAISTDEQKLDLALENTPLAEALKRKLAEAGFPIVQNTSTADYSITIATNVRNLGKFENYFQLVLSLQIVVKNSSGSEIFSYFTDRIRGTHFETSGAVTNAIQEARKQIESTVAGNLIDRVVKGK